MIEVLVDEAQIAGAVGTLEEFKHQIEFAVMGALNQMRTARRNQQDLDYEVYASFEVAS